MGSDDLVARLHEAERHDFQATAYMRVPVHRSDARKLFIEAAAALASRDKEIERLTKERDAESAQALSNLEAMLAAENLAATATRERDEAIRNLSAEARAHGLEQACSDALERERDEARVECERLRAGLEHVCAQATGFGNATVRRMANIARAALHPEGAKDGQS